MSVGLTVEDKSLGRNLGFDSRKPRLQVALNRTPAHHDVLQVKGTAIAVTAAGADTATEDLAIIKHGLGYKPKVLCYFKQASSNRYAVGTFFYDFGVVDDYISYEVDEDKLYIRHSVVDNLGISDYTSDAPSFGNIQVKYLIASVPLEAVISLKRS
jgi:hypothetical protein